MSPSDFSIERRQRIRQNTKRAVGGVTALLVAAPIAGVFWDQSPQSRGAAIVVESSFPTVDEDEQIVTTTLAPTTNPTTTTELTLAPTIPLEVTDATLVFGVSAAIPSTTVTETTLPATTIAETTLAPVPETIAETLPPETAPLETIAPATEAPVIPNEIICDGPFHVPAGTGIIKIEETCAAVGVTVDLPNDYPLNAGEVFDVTNVPEYTPVSAAPSPERESEGCTYTPIRSEKWHSWAFLQGELLGYSDFRAAKLRDAGFDSYYGIDTVEVGERLCLPDDERIRRDFAWIFS